MKQYEAVAKAMEDNGGFATLSYLYDAAVKNLDVKWGTKTPNASIRRIVQEHNELFFKIRPGVWGLVAKRDQFLNDIAAVNAPSIGIKNESPHTFYQMLLAELGKYKLYTTYVPPQDKNKTFMGKPLAAVADTVTCFNFGYDRFLQQARTIDVIWFNRRDMPHAFFEIEYSTDMKNSLSKFVELRDFFAHFFIVAHAARKKEFLAKTRLEAFQSLKERISFLAFSDVEGLVEANKKEFCINTSLGVAL